MKIVKFKSKEKYKYRRKVIIKDLILKMLKIDDKYCE